MRVIKGFVFGSALAIAAATTVVPAERAMARDKLENVCDDLQKPFRKIKNFRRDKAIEGAIIGGLVGALTGVVRNELRPQGQKKSSILPWVIAGAASGGVVGYVTSRAEAAENEEELRKAIEEDYSETLGKFSTMPEMIVALGDCRRQQLFETEQKLENGTISVKEANKRLRRIEKWMRKDDEVISKAADVQFKGVADYTRALRLAEGSKPEETEDQEANFGRFFDQALEEETSVIVVADPSEPVEVPFDTYFVSARSGLNLRSAPDTSVDNKLMTIPHRSEITARDSETADWKEVRYKELEGFAHSDYITFDRPAPLPPQPARGLHKVNYAKKNSGSGKSAAKAIAKHRATQSAMNSNGKANAAQIAQLRATIALQEQGA